MSGSNPRNAEAVHDQGPLDATDLDADPIAQLRVWLADAERSGVVLPNAMALATVGADGSPSVRHVLLRHITQMGITFFTNRTSRKARELAADPRAACTLYWRGARPPGWPPSRAAKVCGREAPPNLSAPAPPRPP